MIYFNELYWRLFFFFLTCVLVFISIYLYQNDFIFILSLPTLKQKFIIEYFIFTTPHEIFYFTLITSISFTFFFLIPYITWSFFDYFKPALRKTEYKIAIYWVIGGLCSFYCLNFIAFFLICPLFWNFFSSFSLENMGSVYKFFFELRAINYYEFLLDIIFISNFIFIIISIFLLIAVRYQKLHLITKKNLILIILIISTIVTPPILELQIFLFVSLYMCLEIFFLIYFFFTLYKGNQLKTINSEETKIK